MLPKVSILTIKDLLIITIFANNVNDNNNFKA